jgi:hypothetical protein
MEEPRTNFSLVITLPGGTLRVQPCFMLARVRTPSSPVRERERERERKRKREGKRERK